MAFKDGVGTSTITPYVMAAVGVVDAVQVTPLSPAQRSSPGTAHLTVIVDNNTAGNSDVELEVSTSNTFGTTAYTTSLTNIADGTYVVLATGLTTGTRYYWRVRASETGMGAWTAWSVYGDPGVAWEFTLAAGASEAHEVITLNLGALNDLDDEAHEVITLNAGFEVVLDDEAHEVITLNVGFEITLDDGGHEYISLGDIDTSTPTPHLWFLLPDSGRPLDGVGVYCTGVGDLPTTYDGVVQIKATTEDDWVDVAVVSWQTFPATPDAYGDDRILDPIAPLIDPQHTVLGITIPADAVPPGYQVRIRTDGP